MLVLALDTSTPAVTAGVVRLRVNNQREPHGVRAAPGGVAGLGEGLGDGFGDGLTRPGTVLAQRSVIDQFAHAERLMPLATEALGEAGHTLHDLDAVVVGLGPGPFTGLRVGIATAAALGDGLDVPVHGVPSHDATARALAQLLRLTEPGDLLVVTDARRREVYLSAYRADGSKLLGPMVVSPAAVPALLVDHRVSPKYIAGAGSALLDAQRGSSFNPFALHAPAGSLSLGLVERAALGLLSGSVPAPLTPLYLRRPDATEPGARKSVLAG